MTEANKDTPVPLDTDNNNSNNNNASDAVGSMDEDRKMPAQPSTLHIIPEDGRNKPSDDEEEDKKMPASIDGGSVPPAPTIYKASPVLVREPPSTEIRDALGNAVQSPPSTSAAKPSPTSFGLDASSSINDNGDSNGESLRNIVAARSRLGRKHDSEADVATASGTPASSASKTSKAEERISRRRIHAGAAAKPGAFSVEAGSETTKEALKRTGGNRRSGEIRASVAAKVGLAMANNSDIIINNTASARKRSPPRQTVTGDNDTDKVFPTASRNKTNVASAAQRPVGNAIAKSHPVSVIEQEKARAVEARRERHAKRRQTGAAAVTPGVEHVDGPRNRDGPMLSKMENEDKKNGESESKKPPNSAVALAGEEEDAKLARKVASAVSVTSTATIDSKISDAELSKVGAVPASKSSQIEQKLDTMFDGANRSGPGNRGGRPLTAEVSNLTDTNNTRSRQTRIENTGDYSSSEDDSSETGDNDDMNLNRGVSIHHQGSEALVSAVLVPETSWTVETVTAVKDNVNRRRLIYGCAVLVVIALIVGIVVSVVIGRRNSTFIPPTSMPSSTPSMSPTFSFDGLTMLLSTVSTDNGTALMTPDTPQNHALQWLANNTFLTDYTDARIIQRYALATLYFSLDGDRWFENANWLDDGNECNWYFAEAPACDDQGRIVEISLRFNFLGLAIPPEIGLLTETAALDLSSNAIVGQLPSEMGMLTKLESLLLNDNLLSGTLPSEVTNLNKLQLLVLDNNKLNGELPNDMGAFTSLILLALDGNRISGTIPASIGNCTSLRKLTFHDNRMTGTIPTEIGLVTMLGEIIAYTNTLTGTIPSEIGNLQSLCKSAL